MKRCWFEFWIAKAEEWSKLSHEEFEEMKKILILKINFDIALTLFALIFTAQFCFASEPDEMNRARIKPTISTIKHGEKQQFYIVVEPKRMISSYATNKVEWFVNGIPGGSKSVGTITNAGLYQAPDKKIYSVEIHIGAKVENVSNRYLWATILLDGVRPQYNMIKEWGESVENLKHLKDPQDIAIEQDGSILIVDGRIKRFSNEGAFINSISETKGEVKGSFVNPFNVALDDEGFIFVSDQSCVPPSIQVLSQDGKYIRGFGASEGIGPGKMMQTHSIAFDSEQRIYIGDIDNMRVSVFEHSGKFLQNIGRKGVKFGEFNIPHGLDLDANNDLFVVSYFGPCQKLTSDGHFLNAFAYADPPDGPVYFTDATCNRWGDVYIIVQGASTPDGGFRVVKDKNGQRVNIIKYNNNGDFIANLQLSNKDRQPVRVVAEKSGKIVVLYKGEKKIGVEVLAQ
jgi:hypothetical protein